MRDQILCITFARHNSQCTHWCNKTLLFIIYIQPCINDFSQASSIFKCIICADDTTLFSNLAYFGNSVGPNIETKESLINTELSNVIKFLTFLTFRRRLPVRGSGSCRDLSIFLCRWPIPP